ncbi:hypothetical protein MUG91_G23n94 [Manis pentadactyla]|nr:hypothetical protein MUG91_G23n94 [Manis pentadactyla]
MVSGEIEFQGYGEAWVTTMVMGNCTSEVLGYGEAWVISKLMVRRKVQRQGLDLRYEGKCEIEVQSYGVAWVTSMLTVRGQVKGEIEFQGHSDTWVTTIVMGNGDIEVLGYGVVWLLLKMTLRGQVQRPGLGLGLGECTIELQIYSEAWVTSKMKDNGGIEVQVYGDGKIEVQVYSEVWVMSMGKGEIEVQGYGEVWVMLNVTGDGMTGVQCHSEAWLKTMVLDRIMVIVSGSDVRVRVTWSYSFTLGSSSDVSLRGYSEAWVLSMVMLETGCNVRCLLHCSVPVLPPLHYSSAPTVAVHQ